MWVGKMSKAGEGSVWARGVWGRVESALGGLLTLLPMVGGGSGDVSWGIGEGGCSRRGAVAEESSLLLLVAAGSGAVCSEGVAGPEVSSACRLDTRWSREDLVESVGGLGLGEGVGRLFAVMLGGGRAYT